MDIFENLMRDPDSMDALLELASYTRQLIAEKQYTAVTEIVRRTVTDSLFEAFLWTAGILQEEFEKKDCCLDDFECHLGRSIPNFNEFMQILQAETDPMKNDVETVSDENGETTSFFNILTYKTGFANIYLVSSENFDTKDNDYIQYKLLFRK